MEEDTPIDNNKIVFWIIVVGAAFLFGSTYHPLSTELTDQHPLAANFTRIGDMVKCFYLNGYDYTFVANISITINNQSYKRYTRPGHGVTLVETISIPNTSYICMMGYDMAVQSDREIWCQQV